MAEFGGATFRGRAWFDGATFRDRADFDGATFRGRADFDGATFRDTAGFGGATFRDWADFDGATFRGTAWFVGATFRDWADFDDATFRGTAGFGQAIFQRFTNFRNSRFEAEADFTAIDVASAFTLVGATFLQVPDFNQAHFAEAPRLDSLRIATGGFWSRSWTQVKGIWKREIAGGAGIVAIGILAARSIAGLVTWVPYAIRATFDGDRITASRWRALKRIALQGLDHAREQEFFRRELLARRWNEDKFWHGAFWFGLLYQFFSGFGISLLRPLCWWLVGAFGFAWAYLVTYLVLGMGGALSGTTVGKAGGWLVDGLRGQLPDWLPGALSAPALPACVTGPGEPVWAAFGLSAQKALFVGVASVDKTRQIHACLFGLRTPEAQPAGTGTLFQAVIPDLVAALAMGQVVFSAAMVFLFGLALRNHFRIK